MDVLWGDNVSDTLGFDPEGRLLLGSFAWSAVKF